MLETDSHPSTISREGAGTNTPKVASYLSIVQALYYIVTGLWALVSIRSFQRVTGPKTDTWLVKTVGVLVTVIGSVLGISGLRQRISPETSVLAIGSAAGLTGIDVIYSARGRISRVYLLDALAEVGLASLWILLRLARTRRAQRRHSSVEYCGELPSGSTGQSAKRSF